METSKMVMISGGQLPTPTDGLTNIERAKKLQFWIDEAVETGESIITDMDAPVVFPYKPDEEDFVIDCKGCEVGNHNGKIIIRTHKDPCHPMAGRLNTK